MNTDTLRLILQSAVAVMVGGGGLAFVRFLLERRSSLRKMDTENAVNTSKITADQSAVYKDMVDQLQSDGVVYRDQLKDFYVKIERLEDKHTQSQRAFTDQLRDAHNENTRLTTRIAQLEIQLDIAERQIMELRKLVS